MKGLPLNGYPAAADLTLRSVPTLPGRSESFLASRKRACFAGSPWIAECPDIRPIRTALFRCLSCRSVTSAITSGTVRRWDFCASRLPTYGPKKAAIRGSQSSLPPEGGNAPIPVISSPCRCARKPTYASTEICLVKPRGASDLPLQPAIAQALEQALRLALCKLSCLTG